MFGMLYRFQPLFYDFFSTEEEINIKLKQINTYQSVIEEKNDLQKKQIILKKRLNKLEGGFLTGSTASLAAVKLQDLIKKITEAEDIQIDSIRVLNPRQQDESNYTLIPVRFTIESNIRKLKGMLFQIESAPELLIIRELSIDSLALRTPGKMRASITVEGIMK